MSVIDQVDRGTVRAAVALATRAPSVHNSQPWRWSLGQRSVHLRTDLRRWLPATDADRRDLVMSCGAALHHLRVALAAMGIGAAVHRLPNPAEGDHLAAVELSPDHPAEADLGLLAAIQKRRTDRRPFSTWPVPDEFLRQLADQAATQGAVLRTVADGRARARLLALLAESAAEQERRPGYDTEVALWSGRRTGDDGIPTGNLLRQAPTVDGQASRRFSAGDLDVDGQADGATLLVLGTASDDTLSQLRAGEALSAVLLRATDLGLATCPLSQPLEVSATRHAVRDEILDGTLCPQLVLRIGWVSGPPLPATPRRPVVDVIDRHSR
jgi:nitroreductase